ncbi:MAG: hypothetical protein ACLPVO_00400 [Desulfomonilaceae bacterium]
MDDMEDRKNKEMDWKAIPAVTHSKTVKGSDVVVHLGITGEFGGVGVAFELASIRSDGSVGAAVNILEARSAAGCGWQTSYGFNYTDKHKHSHLAIFNQAAGNSTPYQWGYGNDYCELAAYHWNPVVSDHTELGPTNPFDGSGVWVDDGKLHIGTGTIDTGAGHVVAITNQYSLRAHEKQTWDWWYAEQAFYLNKAIARSYDLRVHLHGAHDDWVEGPIRPYEDYEVKNSVQSCVCPNSRKFRTKPLDYAVFVWTIEDTDIAIAIQPPGPGCYGHLNASKDIYDQAHPELDTSGSIDWHTVVADTAPNIAHFPKYDPNHPDTIRYYKVDYRVGTPAQLKQLGYSTG